MGKSESMDIDEIFEWNIFLEPPKTSSYWAEATCLCGERLTAFGDTMQELKDMEERGVLAHLAKQAKKYADFRCLKCGKVFHLLVPKQHVKFCTVCGSDGLTEPIRPITEVMKNGRGNRD